MEEFNKLLYKDATGKVPSSDPVKFEQQMQQLNSGCMKFDVYEVGELNVADT